MMIKAKELTAVVTLTDSAIKHVKAQLVKRGTGLGLRLGVKTTGCSGYAYVVDYVDEAHADDHVYSVSDGLAVYVDPESLPYVKGIQLDYITQGLNSGFEFQNPNVKDTCGCGESFSV
ncbi:MAG: iron-sulfur cluster assembly accessory protein [Pseudomonadota bacterium]